jgi:hypothetical protein
LLPFRIANDVYVRLLPDADLIPNSGNRIPLGEGAYGEIVVSSIGEPVTVVYQQGL